MNDIINNFILFKNNSKNINLNKNIFKLFNNLFLINNCNKISIKNINNKNNKNNKNKFKDNLFNKLNSILNKLSHNNINNLVIEFIDNIGGINITDFEEVQKILYLKIINDINFISIYLNFIKIIIYIYNKVSNYTFKFFIDIVESKFKLDYLNINIYDDKLKFIYKLCDNIDVLDELSELKRKNNLILLKNLIDFNFLSNKLIIICTDNIINQNKYLYDIYFWFNLNNIKLSNENNKKILTIINTDISIRDKILLENLIK